MQLARLRLSHFRNYSEQSVPLGPGIHVFEGRNAQGKTALLEAVYLGATARSFRTNKELDLIQWRQDAARVELDLVRDSGRPRQLVLHWSLDGSSCKREIQVQGNPVRRLSDFLSELPCALFTPDDLDLVQEGPQQRRAYLDLLLCKLYPVYLETLGRYQKVLRQKSALLKTQKFPSPAELDSWDDMLTDLGARLTGMRQDVCIQLSPIVARLYSHLSDESTPLELAYRPSGSPDPFQYGQRLSEKRNEELRLRSCVYGPHRDEVEFILGEGAVRRFGSQGQRRTLALALRLAQAEMQREVAHEKPIVLLDDCFSELDPGRQERLLAWLESASQVLITTATPLQIAVPHQLHRVSEGRVRC